MRPSQSPGIKTTVPPSSSPSTINHGPLVVGEEEANHPDHHRPRQQRQRQPSAYHKQISPSDRGWNASGYMQGVHEDADNEADDSADDGVHHEYSDSNTSVGGKDFMKVVDKNTNPRSANFDNPAIGRTVTHQYNLSQASGSPPVPSFKHNLPHHRKGQPTESQTHNRRVDDDGDDGDSDGSEVKKEEEDISHLSLPSLPPEDMHNLTYEELSRYDRRRGDPARMAQERHVVRKLDRHILPLIGILYLFSFLDRVNIGNARLYGFEDAIHLTHGQYNIALGLFFAAYCLFEIPSNLILLRIGPNRWIPSLMVGWGSISLSMAWVTSATNLYIARFFLGMAEAGFVPGVFYYLTMFYKRSEISFRVAIFLSFNILAGSTGGLLAAAISNLDGFLGLHAWQWVFVVEAVPTLMLAGVTWFALAPSPATAWFLNEEERRVAKERIIDDCEIQTSTSTAGPSSHSGHGGWRGTKEALSDVKVWLCALATLSIQTPGAAVVLFMPSLVKDLGYTATPTAILPGWLSNNVIDGAKRASGLAIIVSMAGVGGMAGSQVYRDSDAPRYRIGHLGMVGSLCCCIFCGLLLRFLLVRENKRRDRYLANGSVLAQTMAEGDLSNLGDKHPNFRYTL
ncbi:hypothetical protein BGZ73_006712 [Actinomortierella ambigua]|nr:hypothetical protein BGZ73_006712 [Actinomortierella ambigua]